MRVTFWAFRVIFDGAQHLMPKQKMKRSHSIDSKETMNWTRELHLKIEEENFSLDRIVTKSERAEKFLNIRRLMWFCGKVWVETFEIEWFSFQPRCPFTFTSFVEQHFACEEYHRSRTHNHELEVPVRDHATILPQTPLILTMTSTVKHVTCSSWMGQILKTFCWWPLLTTGHSEVRWWSRGSSNCVYWVALMNSCHCTLQRCSCD